MKKSLSTFLFSLLITLSSFAQDNKWISQDSASIIANNYRHFHSEPTKQQAWTTHKPQLDSLNSIWIITTSKVKYRNYGRTTKNYQSDLRRTCKQVNGCNVRKTKTISIDATTGRVVTRTKEKRVYGNYE